MHKKRRTELIKLLDENSLDSLLIKKKENIFYLTGVRGDDSLLVFTKRSSYLLTDMRYFEEYSRSIRCSKLIVIKKIPALKVAGEIIKRTSLKKIGFESDAFTYNEHALIKKNIKGTDIVPVAGLVESKRSIKDNGEIAHIKAACRLGSEVMRYAIQSASIGITEKELKNKIDLYILKRSLKKADFDIIVASGKNAAFPHAEATDKKIKTGEMVTIDLGISYKNYISDLTRTVYLGKINSRYNNIYNIVKDAQKKAIENIRPGTRADHIDNISRQYITEKGFGKFFVHSLGHGIGLKTHEAPAISKNSTTVLLEGMTLTVEPGIYIAGWGGIRIEDDVLVTKNGCRVLTNIERSILCK